VAVPLKAKDRVIGVIVAGNRTGKPFSERDQAMLSAVADYAVIAIVNGRFFQAMEARVQQLQHSYEAQVADHGRKDQNLQRIAQQLRAPLIQARGTLEPLVNGQNGTLTPQQADSIHAALERLAALQRLVDELPATAAAANGPKTTT
jgi:GAF domain-containing protein